jgi:predicted acyl esterase
VAFRGRRVDDRVSDDDWLSSERRKFWGRTVVTPETIGIPSSGDVTLTASRYAARQTPAPAVVAFTPYRREETFFAQYIELANELGCDFVAVDVPGLGGSGGVWDGPYSLREVAACVQALEWLADWELCDGRTGLVGHSYLGGIQYLIAAQRPRGLRCIAPEIAPVDFYRDLWHRGGIPSHANWGALVGQASQQKPGALARVTEEFYGTTLADPFDGERPRSRSSEGVLGEIEIPTLVTGGWYDHFLRATVRAFEHLRAPKRLILGNWPHDPLPPEERHELLRWLGYWLRDEGEDPTVGSNVRLQVVGSDKWEVRSGWPSSEEILWRSWAPVSEPTQISIETSLGPVEPSSESHLDSAYDLATDSGMRIWGEAWSAEMPAVEQPSRFLGPVALSARLLVTDVADFDLHARLSLVRTDGSIHQVTEGRLRASHRAIDRDRSAVGPAGDILIPWHPHDQAEPLLAGTPTTLDVEIFPINIEIAEGERLRLGISLVRADPVTETSHAMLLPETRVLLPAVKGTGPF